MSVRGKERLPMISLDWTVKVMANLNINKHQNMQDNCEKIKSLPTEQTLVIQGIQ